RSVVLGQAEPVARVVTEHCLDAVGSLGWLLQERHAATGQLLVGLAAVVGLPYAAAECALGDEFPQLLGRLLVVSPLRRGEAELQSRPARWGHGQPAESLSGTGEIGAHLDIVARCEAELLGVELLGGVLVEHEHPGMRQLADHVLSSPPVRSVGSIRADAT